MLLSCDRSILRFYECGFVGMLNSTFSTFSAIRKFNILFSAIRSYRYHFSTSCFCCKSFSHNLLKIFESLDFERFSLMPVFAIAQNRRFERFFLIWSIYYTLQKQQKSEALHLAIFYPLFGISQNRRTHPRTLPGDRPKHTTQWHRLHGIHRRLVSRALRSAYAAHK